MRMLRRAAIAAGLLALVAVGLLWLAHIPLSSETLRRRIVTSLGNIFESKVELDSVEFRLLPRMHVVGHGLVIRHRKHEEVPLIAVRQFAVSTSITSLWRSHVEDVVLDGLEIQLPPKDKDDAADVEPVAAYAPTATGDETARMTRQIVIDRLRADDSTLQEVR